MKKQNFVLGAGKLYFAPEDENGNTAAERYLGDTPGFTVTVESQQLQKFTSDGPLAELADEATTQVTRDGSIQCENISNENLALFVIGLLETLQQAAGPVTDEPISGVQQGRYYQLGVDADNPTGVRNIDTVVVEDDAAAAFVAGTDYELDAELGRLYIVPGGAIVDGANLLVDYDTLASTRSRISSQDTAPKRGALRYIADNTRGENRDLYAPKVQMRPSGELAMKSRDTWQRMTFSTAFQKPDVGSALYIDGRAVA